eukprot:TRINITY_DN701_c0_g2_i3.p1 TRINITY_DN701_c0_g2~~TRINITY_DN701_c0_g2_i3.p1  ORF type:complete len:647 (+),score=313.73 TRINITY_DN701_c0_g2_i3:1103-3043(+)
MNYLKYGLVASAGITAYLLYNFYTWEGDSTGGGTFESVYGDLSAIKVTANFASKKKALRQPPLNAPIKPVLILYGTEYGTSRDLAYKFETQLLNQNKDLWPRVVDMENFNFLEFDKETLIFIICSTYGDGVPPTTARNFFDKLEQNNFNFSHINYSVLALGDKNYPHFCRAGKTINERFKSFGANEIIARADVDQEDTYIIKKWMDSAIECSFNILVKEIDIDYLWEKSSQIEMNSTKISRQRPYLARILERKCLTNLDNLDDKDTIHIEFELEDNCGIEWICGDALGVLPTNCPQEIEAILAILNTNERNQLFEVPSWHYQPSNGIEPQPTSRLNVEQLLMKCYDLKNVNPELFILISKHTTEQNEIQKINDLLINGSISKQNVILYEYIKKREIIDIFEDFQLAIKKIPIQTLLNHLKPLLPRYYSISSSFKKDPKRVTITVAIVRYNQLAKARKGVTTTYLADRVSIGDRIPIFINTSPDFRLPNDDNKPIVMIGPGTGVAPFRAFLQERSLSLNFEAIQNILYFGCRSENKDFLYKQEFTNLEQNNHLTLVTAFSRDQQRKIYVQDRLLENADSIWNALENGAHFYICGDAQYMAPDVEAAIKSIIHKNLQNNNNNNNNQITSDEYFNQLEKQNRYQRDVWF